MTGAELKEKVRRLKIKNADLVKACGFKNVRVLYWHYEDPANSIEVPQALLDQYEAGIKTFGKSLYDEPIVGPNVDILTQALYKYEKELEIALETIENLKKHSAELNESYKNQINILTASNKVLTEIIQTGLKKDAIKFDVKASGIKLSWVDEGV